MAAERSEFNRIMGKIQGAKDDLAALQNRADGLAFVQSVSYAELDEITSRLDTINEEALDFYEHNSERYKIMEKNLLSLREEVAHARKMKDYTSNR